MKKYKPPLTLQDIEDSVSNWEEHLKWILRRDYDEYDWDIWARLELERDLSEYEAHPIPEALQERIDKADLTFRNFTREVNSCSLREDDNEFADKKRFWFLYRTPIA